MVPTCTPIESIQIHVFNQLPFLNLKICRITTSLISSTKLSLCDTSALRIEVDHDIRISSNRMITKAFVREYRSNPAMLRWVNMVFRPLDVHMEVTTLKVRKYFYGTMFTEYSLVLSVCRIIYCIISGRWCACFYRLSPEMFGDGCIPAGHFFELIWFQDIPGMSHWYFKLNLDRY